MQNNSKISQKQSSRNGNCHTSNVEDGDVHVNAVVHVTKGKEH